MYIEQLYTNCLAEAAYYIESCDEATIIDPLRDPEPYIAMAKRRNTKIKYILETHFHADFVSGHVDLAQKTGATIVYGPKATPQYAAHIAKDNEELLLGDIKLRVLHTPGHTPESSCYLLIDENDVPQAVFTGDTLFIGDVGRPDLAIKSDLTQDDLAGMLYDSLHTKILTLPDSVIVYPAHGAGSACGKNISKETSSTIGMQRATNYALKAKSKADFIKEVTDGLMAAPKYFFYDAAMNREGYQSLDAVMKENFIALSPNEFERQAAMTDTLVLDTRDGMVYGNEHIPNALNIGLNGQYAPWVGTIIDTKTRLLLVASEGNEEEAVVRLARIGYENVAGYLEGGMTAWKASGKKVESIVSVTPAEFLKADRSGATVLDVRNPGEWGIGKLREAITIPLGDLSDKLSGLPKDETIYVHCAGGYRSMIAASLLQRNHVGHIINISDGLAALRELGAEVVY